MLKAYVKLSVTIHLEDEAENPSSNGDLKDPAVAKARIEADIYRPTIKYPLTTSLAGSAIVNDLAAANRMLSNLGAGAFQGLGIRVVDGGHRPDLAAAFGGCPEKEDLS